MSNLLDEMHFLQQSESTESLSAWSPLACERNQHAQRYFLSSAAKKRKLPPTRLDRTVLDRTFRRLEGNQSTDCEKVKASTTNEYRAENARLKGARKVFKTKPRDKSSCEKGDYEVQIGKEYKAFDGEFIALRVDSVRMLSCSYGDGHTDDGWRQVADRVQQYLGRVQQFFLSKLSHVNSMESMWTLRRRTLALEVLKKLYARDVSRMDAWIESVVEA